MVGAQSRMVSTRSSTGVLVLVRMLEVRTIVMVGVAREMMPEGWGLLQKGSMMEMSRVRLVGMEIGNLLEGVTMVMMYRNKQTVPEMMMVGKGSKLMEVQQFSSAVGEREGAW